MSPKVDPEDLRDVWPILTLEERIEGFESLERDAAREFFQSLSSRSRAQILLGCPPGERVLWMRQMAPDDAADALREVPDEERAGLLALLEGAARREVSALLAYGEDQAGGLMSPRFVRVRPEMSVDEAIRYVRRQAQDPIETIYYVYVLERDQRLAGVVSFRELLTAPGERSVREIMRSEPETVREDLDQEALARIFHRTGFLALPVVDGEGRVKGIVTIDDIVDVVQEEATEDAQKFGGMEALDAPYLQTGFGRMIQKRAGWLAVLFVGEMFTASAMARFEDELVRYVVLALFVPLIISSGGNAGSQASTLIIRAMALGEVRLRDWWRIVRRELAAGLTLGLILAGLGAARIVLWERLFESYGEVTSRLALTVGLSLLGVVTFGTLSGSMLPFLLRRAGLDPASASAPLVATMVDVTGLVIYFSTASLVLRGALL